MIKKTKTTDFPSGVAWKVIKIMKTKNKPKDASAEIHLKKELEAVQFGMANDYFNLIVTVQGRYEVDVTDTKLIKIMATKVQSTVYAKMIIGHLNGAAADDFDALCSKITEIQRLTKTMSGGRTPKVEKEVQLANTDGNRFNGVCGYCNKKAGHKRAQCPDKAAGKPPANSGGGGGGRPGGGGGGSNKTCNHCGGRGRTENDCWKKNPDKAPVWYKQKSEASGASVEMMLASVEAPIFDNGASTNSTRKQAVVSSSIEAEKQAAAECKSEEFKTIVDQFKYCMEVERPNVAETVKKICGIKTDSDCKSCKKIVHKQDFAHAR